MRAHQRIKLTLAWVMSCVLCACDLQSGDQSRDVLWQAEVEAVAMGVHADAAAEGNMEAFDSLRDSRDAVEAALGASASKPVSADIGSTWLETRKVADVVLSHREAVLVMVDAEADFSAAVPQLMARIDEVARSVSEGDPRGASKQVYLLGRAQLLLQRMQRRAEQARAGRSDAMAAADAFNRDGAILDKALAGLQDGNAELAIEAIASPQARAVLIEVRPLFTEARAKVEPLFSAMAAMLETREAADDLPAAVAELRSALQRGRVRR